MFSCAAVKKWRWSVAFVPELQLAKKVGKVRGGENRGLHFVYRTVYRPEACEIASFEKAY